MYVTPSAPQSIGGVIDDAIRLYRHSLSRCWLLGLVPSALLGALMLVLALLIPGYTVAAGRGAEVLAAQHAYRTVMGTYLLFAVLMFGFQGAITARQAAIARGDSSFSLGRALATGFARLPIFILSAILFYLGIVGGASAVIVVVALPIGWLLNHQHLLVRPVVGGGIITAVLVSSLYLVGRLQLFIVAIFADRKGPKSSLTASWHLTKGHWWRAMAILGVAMAIILVLFIAVILLNDLVAFMTHFSTSYRFVISPLILVVCYTFMYPMGPALWVAMYNDFKLRREGGDLAARVGALNSA